MPGFVLPSGALALVVVVVVVVGVVVGVVSSVVGSSVGASVVCSTGGCSGAGCTPGFGGRCGPGPPWFWAGVWLPPWSLTDAGAGSPVLGVSVRRRLWVEKTHHLPELMANDPQRLRQIAVVTDDHEAVRVVPERVGQEVGR